MPLEFEITDELLDRTYEELAFAKWERKQTPAKELFWADFVIA